MAVADTVAEIQDLATLIGAGKMPHADPRLNQLAKIGNASELHALAERLVAEIVGESQALPGRERPSWTDLSRVLKKLGADGNPVLSGISRQGVRKRYSTQPQVVLMRDKAHERELQGIITRMQRELEQLPLRVRNQAERRKLQHLAQQELAAVEAERLAVAERVLTTERQLAHAASTRRSPRSALPASSRGRTVRR